MEPIARPLISFVVLHYFDIGAVNNLATEITSLWKDAEIIIVDNSGDFVLRNDIPAQHIRIFTPGYNSGFSRGVNVGLKNANGHFIALINQDVVGLQSISPIIKRLDIHTRQKEILCVRLLSSDGAFQQSVWPDYPSLEKEWKDSTFYSYWGGKENTATRQRQIEALHQTSGYVERGNGAFLLFNRRLVDDDKLFWDENFFLYGEDVEWAWRSTRKGWHFYYDGGISLTHIGSASSPNQTIKNLQVILSDFLFVAKSNPWFYSVVFLAFVYMSSLLDLFLLNRSKRQAGQIEKPMWLNRKMKVYLVRKYAWLLLTKKNYSGSNFLFNCYENDQAFAATLSAQG